MRDRWSAISQSQLGDLMTGGVFLNIPSMDATDAARSGISQAWPPHTDGVEVCMVGAV